MIDARVALKDSAASQSKAIIVTGSPGRSEMSIRAIVALAKQTVRMANGYIRNAVESGLLTEERPPKRGQRELSRRPNITVVQR
jgi:hypothetical protein